MGFYPTMTKSIPLSLSLRLLPSLGHVASLALLLALLLGFSACASSKHDPAPASITFIRQGGFSGLEDRYTIERNGHATKTMRFPRQEEKRVADTMLAQSTVAPIFSFIDRNLDSLLAIKYDETGNMTTTLILVGAIKLSSIKDEPSSSHIIRWPNLEPPILETKKLDSLYALISPVQEWLSATQ